MDGTGMISIPHLLRVAWPPPKSSSFLLTRTKSAHSLYTRSNVEQRLVLVLADGLAGAGASTDSTSRQQSVCRMLLCPTERFRSSCHGRSHTTQFRLLHGVSLSSPIPRIHEYSYLYLPCPT